MKETGHLFLTQLITHRNYIIVQNIILYSYWKKKVSIT